MKVFLRKVFVFTIVSFFLIFILFFLTNSLIKRNASFKLKPSVSNLIFGHSHSECAFNDSLITNFKNLSESRQSYFYSFLKIKKVISENNDIENVFIEFSNNQIVEDMNNWIWDDSSITSKSQYLSFLESRDINLLLEKNPKSFIKGSSKSFRNNIMNVLLFNYDYTDKIGGYRWLNRFKMDSLLSTTIKRDSLTTSSNDNSNSIKLSDKNIEYLDKIIAYCKENNKNIYFVRSPQHIYFEERKNEEIFMKVKNEKFNDIIFLDFNDFPLDDHEFGDFGHLNYKGAKKFSLWFNQLLNKGLLTKIDQNTFIKNEIEKLQMSNNILDK